MRDFELPNGLQDSDLEMNSLNELARQEAQLKKQGKCTHGWRQRGQGITIPIGKTKCLNCGKISTWEELEQERKELLI